MLANKVLVEVFGELTENVYSGYVKKDNITTKAYIITKKNVNDVFSGIVVAEITFVGGEKAFVISGQDEILYEPEIRTNLEKLKNKEIEKINCLYEKSCGAVIFYAGKSNTKILLVKNNNGRFWSFPKGHIEKGETEKETATREIKEETGLDVEIKDGFREVSDYCPYGKIRKNVVFFLAQAYTDVVKVQEEEIAEYIWVDLQQAHKICTYENDLRVIEKAITAIKLVK